LGKQSNIVQYPPGCEVSHWRLPCVEQSVATAHLSPMDGAHPMSETNESAATSAPQRVSPTEFERSMVRGG
jgi:hypothetical protein